MYVYRFGTTTTGIWRHPIKRGATGVSVITSKLRATLTKQLTRVHTQILIYVCIPILNILCICICTCSRQANYIGKIEIYMYRLLGVYTWQKEVKVWRCIGTKREWQTHRRTERNCNSKSTCPESNTRVSLSCKRLW